MDAPVKVQDPYVGVRGAGLVPLKQKGTRRGSDYAGRLSAQLGRFTELVLMQTWLVLSKTWREINHISASHLPWSANPPTRQAQIYAQESRLPGALSRPKK